MAAETTRDMTRGGQFALIPASVLYDDQIPATAKLLYGEIYRLSHANGYCYASNRDFMSILLCSEKTVSRLIAALAERGHIRVKLIRRYGARGDITQRRIFCGQELAREDPPEEAGGMDKIDHTSPQNCPDGMDKNVHHTTKSNIYNKPPIVPQGTDAQLLFERFWKAYPKKKGKEAARRAWKKLSPDLELCRVMSAALEQQKRSTQWLRDSGAYIPYPATWLNGRRWEDEPDLPDAVPAAYDEEGFDGI